MIPVTQTKSKWKQIQMHSYYYLRVPLGFVDLKKKQEQPLWRRQGTFFHLLQVKTSLPSYHFRYAPYMH